jgi:Transposase DDE domain
VLDPETFLTELYVLVDDFSKTELPPERHAGPAAALCRSEVLTLAIFGQWARFGSEREFWRSADARLRPLFPRLPDRTQFNRALRRQQAALTAFGLWLARRLGAAPGPPYAALDATAVPTRNVKRRGVGWLAGRADLGWSNRLGWYHGFSRLLTVTPAGIVTGWGVGPASANDRALADVLFALRAAPDRRLPSVGQAAAGVSVADRGFAGTECERRWLGHGAQRVARPQPDAARARHWSVAWRRWLATHRQIVETVIGRLQARFRLDRDRPHALDGFQARLAAKIALHHTCVWLNRQHARPDLAVADLLGW